MTRNEMRRFCDGFAAREAFSNQGLEAMNRHAARTLVSFRALNAVSCNLERIF